MDCLTAVNTWSSVVTESGTEIPTTLTLVAKSLDSVCLSTPKNLMYLLSCIPWMNLANAGLSLNAAAASADDRFRSTLSQFGGRAIAKPSAFTEYSFQPGSRLGAGVGVDCAAVPVEAPQAASSSATRTAGTHPTARLTTVGYIPR